MPNHFLTVGLCTRNYDLLEASGKADFDFSGLEGANLCEIIAELPKDFDGICAQNEPVRFRHKETGEFCTDVNGPSPDSRHEYEIVPLTSEERNELIRRHGSETWIDWQVANWGTKWGVYGVKVHELGGDFQPVLIEFQSAWGPPNQRMMRQITEYLKSNYFINVERWIGHDPSSRSVIDIELAG